MYANIPMLFEYEETILVEAVRTAYRMAADKAMTGVIDREYHAQKAHEYKRLLEVLSPKHVGH